MAEGARVGVSGTAGRRRILARWRPSPEWEEGSVVGGGPESSHPPASGAREKFLALHLSLVRTRADLSVPADEEAPHGETLSCLSSGLPQASPQPKYPGAYRGPGLGHSSSVAEKPLWGQGMLPVQFPETGSGLVLLGG